MTERERHTVLRALTAEDAERLTAEFSAPNALPGYCLPAAVEDMQALISEWNAGSYRGEYFQMLLVTHDGAPAGLLSLYGHGTSVSLGISLLEECRGKGVGSRAVEAAISLAKQAGFSKLTAQCRTDNAPCRTLLAKFMRLTETVNAKGNRVYCGVYELR